MNIFDMVNLKEKVEEIEKMSITRKINSGVKIITGVRITSERDNLNTSDVVRAHAGEELLSGSHCMWGSNVVQDKKKVDAIFKKYGGMEILIKTDLEVYRAEVIEVIFAKDFNEEKIESPDSSHTVGYYKEERYKTWYKLKNIKKLEEEYLSNIVTHYNTKCKIEDAFYNRPTLRYFVEYKN